MSEMGAPAAEAVGRVTVDDVLHVAELANLELTADEVPRMQRDLNAVLGYIAQLNELDTAGVPTHPDGPHSKEGCRIGDRLDLVVGDRDAAQARVAELEKALEEKAKTVTQPPFEFIDGQSFRPCKGCDDVGPHAQVGAQAVMPVVGFLPPLSSPSLIRNSKASS